MGILQTVGSSFFRVLSSFFYILPGCNELYNFYQVHSRLSVNKNIAYYPSQMTVFFLPIPLFPIYKMTIISSFTYTK